MSRTTGGGDASGQRRLPPKRTSSLLSKPQGHQLLSNMKRTSSPPKQSRPLSSRDESPMSRRMPPTPSMSPGLVHTTALGSPGRQSPMAQTSPRVQMLLSRPGSESPRNSPTIDAFEGDPDEEYSGGAPVHRSCSASGRWSSPGDLLEYKYPRMPSSPEGRLLRHQQRHYELSGLPGGRPRSCSPHLMSRRPDWRGSSPGSHWEEDRGNLQRPPSRIQGRAERLMYSDPGQSPSSPTGPLNRQDGQQGVAGPWWGSSSGEGQPPRQASPGQGVGDVIMFRNPLSNAGGMLDGEGM